MPRIKITGGTIGDGTDIGAVTIVTHPDRTIRYEHAVIVLGDQALDVERSSAQYATATRVSPLELTSSFTIEMWIKPESIPNTQSFGLLTDRGGAGRWNFTFRHTATQRLSMTIVTPSGSTTIDSSPTFISASEYTHIAAVVDMVTGNKINVDFYEGLVAVGGGEDSGIGTSMSGTDGGNIDIGRITSGDEFDGLIDEVRIWSGTRTAVQISGSASLVVTPASEPTLLAYWRFADTTDELGNHNLTFINGASLVEDTPFN